jgi:MFS family permease
MVARLGFRRWLPFLMFAWGIVSCLQAFMTNRTGFFITRALIGAFESGYIPGAVAM